MMLYLKCGECGEGDAVGLASCWWLRMELPRYQSQDAADPVKRYSALVGLNHVTCWFDAPGRRKADDCFQCLVIAIRSVE